MKRKNTIISGICLILMVLFVQTASQGNGVVQAQGNYPYLGQEVPLQWPNCTPNGSTAVVSTDDQIETVMDDPNIKVICLNPGSYGEIKLEIPGTAQSPRYLIPNHNNGDPVIKPWELPQNQRVRVQDILVKSSYWNVRSLNVVADIGLIVEFRVGAHHNVIDNVLMEGISERLAPNAGNRTMVRIREATYYNHIQNSVLRNPPRIPGDDSHCLVIRDSQWNTIINNQIYNCPGDGIQIATVGASNWDNRGTKIIGNQIYITSSLYADCNDSSIDANLNGPGECACAENAIDIKHNVANPVDNNQDKMEIRSNIMYGFRETHPTCGGSGDKTAPVIYLQNETTKDILIEGNVLAWSDTGIQLKDTGNGGPDQISFLNNLVYNITKKRAIQIAGGQENQFSHNTIVMTLNDGNLSGRHSIAIVGTAVSALISNNLFLSSNINYRGYTDLTDTSNFVFRDNGFVQGASPVPEIPGTNTHNFPNEPLTNYASYCFENAMFTNPTQTCYPYLIPGPTAATVDIIQTSAFGIPYDFRYLSRVLPYDIGATEVPSYAFFNFLPSITKK